MDNKEFNKEDLEFFLPKTFKGLNKQYILDCIFNKEIQDKWQPEEGDVIVGGTGNVFTISNKTHLHEDLGGDLFHFGGGMCSRDGGNIMNETYTYTMNKYGKWITWNNGKLTEIKNFYHSKFSDFKFIPYPHETHRI